jgi:uncharacterized protein YbjT (DUF2867 family)
MKTHRIALIGGSGFVGRHLVRHLTNLGHECRVVTRHPHRHRDIAAFAEVLEADPYAHDSVAPVFDGTDTVINLAGILNSDRKHNTFRRVHVELVENIVAACRTAGVSRLLHMSALNADQSRGSSSYLRSKGEGENRAHTLGQPFMGVTSFRPSVIFGADDSFLNRFASLLAIPGPLPLACPNARLAPVYIGDVVRAFTAALDDPQTHGQRYDLCGPRAYTLAELVRFIADETGRRKLIIPLPDWASRAQAAVLQYVPGRPFTPDNYLSLQTDSVCDANGLDAFGITPVSLANAGHRFLAHQDKSGRLSRLRRDSGR